MHKEEAILYCSDCEEPICSECVESGHEEKEGHHIHDLLELGRDRAEYLHSELNRRVEEKRVELKREREKVEE